MNWKTEDKRIFTTSIFRDNKVISFEVMSDGHYRVFDKNSSDGLKILASGFVSGGYSKAINYLDSIYENDNTILNNSALDEEIVVSPIVENIKDEINDSLITDNEIQVLIVHNEEDITVELLCEKATSIKYTLNGKPVINTSKIYKEPFNTKFGTILNAIAFKEKEIISKIENKELS